MFPRLSYHLFLQYLFIQSLRKEYSRNLPKEFREQNKRLPWKKYTVFYGTLMPEIIHRPLAELHKIKYDRDIKLFSGRQALITGLADDLYDRLALSSERIRDLLQSKPDLHLPGTVEEYFCQAIHTDLFRSCPAGRERLSKSISAVMEAQEESRSRTNPSLSKEEILRTGLKKGAAAILFYRCAVSAEVASEEALFLEALGGLLQLTNDINDASEDFTEGTQTIMTAGFSLQEIRHIFENLHTRVLHRWSDLSPALYNKKKFMKRINIILARTYLTLRRYKKFYPDDLPFDIRRIPSHRIISELRIPSLPGWGYEFLQISVQRKKHGIIRTIHKGNKGFRRK